MENINEIKITYLFAKISGITIFRDKASIQKKCRESSQSRKKLTEVVPKHL